MRRVLLVGHVDPSDEERLVHELRSHEPVTAYAEAGLRGCSIFAGRGHVAVFLETDDDFQTAYRRLLQAPSWRALLGKLKPLSADVPGPGELAESGRMPFSGEITRWPPERTVDQSGVAEAREHDSLEARRRQPADRLP